MRDRRTNRLGQIAIATAACMHACMHVSSSSFETIKESTAPLFSEPDSTSSQTGADTYKSYLKNKCATFYI